MSSLSKAQDAAASKLNFTRHDTQIQVDLQASSSSFTFWRKEDNTSNTTSLQCSLVLANKNKIEESDEDSFIVPDMESQPPAANVATYGVVKKSNSNNYNGNQDQVQHQAGTTKRRRGRNSVDKEHRRIKRLLRNRVSAQQARERKKVFVNDLESRANELQDKYAKLEERISTLTNENAMLRKVLMNSRPTKCDGSHEPKDDPLSKS